MQNSSTQIVLKPSPKPIETAPKPSNEEPKRTDTSKITSKETCPTLVDFQNKNALLPEWRLQLKNAVLKRKGESNPNLESIESVDTISIAKSNSYPTSEANAVKAELVEEIQPSSIDNEQLINALKRIEQSRKKFHIVEKELSPPSETEAQTEEPVKDYPFTIATRNDNPTIEQNLEVKTSENFPTKPTLVPTPKPRKIYQTGDLYDTSELDPNFISAKISSSFENRPKTAEKKTKTQAVKKDSQETEAIVDPDNQIESKIAIIDDVAPFSLRFNAGLFDLIIGSFSSMILLAPFVVLGGSWFTVAGFFAFLATSAIVMFIYLTTTIGMFGKTFGMHLFSIEMIDYFDDEYPTFHQSAVSSSIYLLSLAIGGLGFITAFFDEDKRAVHDLVSGTVVVKEI